MEFTNNWFEITAKRSWDRLFVECKYRPQRVLEVGSFEGKSTCYLIDVLKDVKNAEIHCVDTWGGGHDHSGVDMAAVEKRFQANVQEACESSPVKVVTHKQLSFFVLSRFISEHCSESFDFIYIDGSHLACDVFTDAALAFRLLKVGGVLVFDDYLWRDSFNPLFSPKLAIDVFVSVHFDKLEVLEAAISQLHLRKVKA